MINRRILRIKAFQILYAYFKSGNNSLDNSRKELHFCINKTYELYFNILLLIIDVFDYAEKIIEIRKNKNLPSKEDLNPNLRLVNNRLIKKIRETKDIISYKNNNKFSWANYPELTKKIYNSIVKSDYYNAYMTKSVNDYNNDKLFIKKIIENEFTTSKYFYDILDEMSIYWGDDVEYVLNMLIKSIKKDTENNTEFILMDKFKNIDDKNFVDKLFIKTIANHDKNKKIIDANTKNWELDRIAFVDMLLMEMAITEAIEMPEIPTKVSLNEYIELAKLFSSKKSSVFINGILDKTFINLKKEKIIIKKGSGLIGE